MDKQYFERNEKNGYQKLKEFNDIVHLFPTVDRTPKLHEYDASATTNSKTYNIEIKLRNQVLLDDGRVSGHSEQSGRDYIDDTIMIESHKMASQLLYASFYGYTPIYVNFLLDGTVVIFNLHNLKIFPIKKDNVQTYSRGYQRKEQERKYYLDLQDACIYDKDHNLIKKAGDKWKTNN